MPFIHLTKREVVQIAYDMGAPLELTWSCPTSAQEPCGSCNPCVDRQDALEHLKK